LNKVIRMNVRPNMCIELIYQDAVDQSNDEELQRYSDMMKVSFGSAAECDWRDDHTLWIWVNGYPFHKVGE